MFDILPGLDERMELFLISGTASFVAIQAAGPLLRAFKRTRVAARVKALLGAEAELNAEVADAIESFKAGSNVVAYAKEVNAAERALRALEADAATRRMRAAQVDGLQAQLAFLVALQSGSAQGADAAVAKAARATVESTLEKDARAQQATIDAAIKALAAGATTPADDTVAPLYAKAFDAARKQVAAQPAAKPFSSAAIQEIFRKRFGLSACAAGRAEGARERRARAAPARPPPTPAPNPPIRSR